MSAGNFIGLGLDAGGTQTRWALADGGGAVLAEGSVEGMTGLLLNSEAGRVQLRAALVALAATVRSHGQPAAVCAGFTGVDGTARMLAEMIAAPLEISADAVAMKSDIEIAYLDLFAPGEGYVVYAGTGSIAAFIEAGGTFHRAGGRGVMLDDAGGGFWIAREALRHIWRREDEQPGAWRDSLMALEIFKRIGGDDWSFTRRFVYAGERGEIGKLALAVAEAESSFNPKAEHKNADGSADRGLYQINSKWHPEVSEAQAYDPEFATEFFCKAVKDGNLSWWNSSKPRWIEKVYS